ncbi:zinc ribbon domain-containing protein [Pseudothermotoga sp.]|uniref:zinc ribbon domain-containing protein n=1 Tax=Pseudothermotoga sp. TaxID=2033661 RepID=UPI0031FCB405
MRVHSSKIHLFLLLILSLQNSDSQECFACGKRHRLSLADRVIKCGCGWNCDRDVNVEVESPLLQ